MDADHTLCQPVQISRAPLLKTEGREEGRAMASIYKIKKSSILPPTGGVLEIKIPVH